MVLSISRARPTPATKRFGPPKRGAIFLPNVDDKHMRCLTKDGSDNPLSNNELAACHNASGHLLLAPEYVAPLKTAPLNISDAATAQIYATPRAAYDHFRLFVLDNPNDVRWLFIGHVDEFVQFLPYNNTLGFTIPIADTRSGLSMLEDLQAAGHGSLQAISFPNNSTDAEEPGLGDTIDEILANTTSTRANAYAQRHIDANLEVLLPEIPLAREDVIYVPTLFRDTSFGPWGIGAGDDGLPLHTDTIVDGERQMVAFYSASINGIVIGSRYLSPKPLGPTVNGTDMLAQAVEKSYAKARITVGYVDDFLSHHLGTGEIHCGSNTLRQTDAIWWN